MMVEEVAYILARPCADRDGMRIVGLDLEQELDGGRWCLYR